MLPSEAVVGVEKLKNGYDIKITDKRIASSVVKQLRDRFDVKDSYKLAGEKKGKKLYRNYYAVR